MAKFCRHLKALLKKNLILWYRNPICAVFEIMMPLALMIGLAAIRSGVATTDTDAKAMLAKKQVSMQGAGF